MAANGLVITPYQDTAVVNFANASILDAQIIEAIGATLYELIEQQARRRVILDFTPVKFLSSQMLGVIVNLHKKSKAIKGRVILCGLRPEVMKVFTITRIDRILEITDTEEAAMKLLGLAK